MSSSSVDLIGMAHLLQAGGWDVTGGVGEVMASREDQGGAWTLAIDRSGRLLFTAVTSLRPAQTAAQTRGEATYRTSWEEEGIFTLAASVHVVADLQQALADLDDLMRQARRRRHTRS
jgi:hypothetical protein